MPSTITLPGTMESLYALMGFVTSFAGKQGFSPEKIRTLELAMEEVLVNIIKYAYRDDDSTGSIEITCTCCPERGLVIEVVDSGVPFDIFSVPDPDVSADMEERRIGGLGIFLVKQLMDDVRYRREDNRNRLTLVIDGAKT
ncbi:ATP-binding protein [Syntrophus buswellii]|uniref:ATP-binding protein n=1 Tax=Syntrophus TaxID=43773 RepID=UPI00345E1506